MAPNRHPWSVAPQERLSWLPTSPHPLDWMGPVSRAFRAFPDEDLERPILELVGRAAQAGPDRPAVSDGRARLSYGELWESVPRLAAAIGGRTRAGELVAIVLPSSVQIPVAMLACLAAGRPFLMLDAHAPREWLDAALEEARPGLVLSEDFLRAAPARVDWRPGEELGADAPACVIFTSGSSGRAKGIVNSQRNLLQRAAQSINAAHINAEDRLVTLASSAAIVGVRDILTALVAGASIRLVEAQRAGGSETLHVLREEAISILFAMPALLRMLAPGDAARAPETLRLVRTGGDTFTWSDVERLRDWLQPDAAIQSVYAATEAPMMQCFVHEELRGEDACVPIGYPLAGNRLAVTEEDELVVASRYVALGRWSAGACVAAESCSEGRIFRTGDVVRVRADGMIERLGRKDRQIKVRGHRVELEGVEAVLRAHRHVRDAGVLARETGGEASLVAYVSACEGAPGTLIDELKIAMRAAPPAMRPARYCLVESVPRLANSKLDVRALAAMDAREAAPAVEPTDRVARAVDAAWRAALERPASRPEEDFFEAGGDSLKAISFMLALERALGEALPVTLINEAPTFAGLCAALKDRRAGGVLVTLKAGEGDAPAVFIVHGIGGNVVELFALARRMDHPGAVIGVQARGLSDARAPHASVIAMARDYLGDIRARQPRGPYHLCGYSFGGLVAFEMARMLKEAGEEVGLVGLFDTMMSPVRWPAKAWASIIRRRIVRLWRGGKPKRDVLKDAPPGSVRVAASALMASARYRPGFYDGEITLFSPACKERGLPSLQEIWTKHAGAVRVVEIPGEHATMLSGRNAEHAAAALRQALPRPHDRSL
ncbi:MAG: AMP-binding protein [Hyphomonadaceae bacterium]|nr:AMP-binding protein [Hyphomonadaceae bacterium]